MRTKKAIINYITETVPEILIMFLGFFRIKFFLKYLGTDILGLYQMFGQFFAYINLTEAGFSTAALYSLYKPISDKDQKKVNSILSGTNRIFKIIGLGMILIGIIFSFFIHYFIKDNTISNGYIITSFIIFLLINVMSYFFKPYSIYFDAKEKKYLPNLIYQIGLLVKTISEIALLFIGFDLIKILIVSLCIMIITNFAVKYAMKKQFPEVDLKVEKDYSAWKGTKHLIVHKLGGVVANNVDMIMISTFTGLAKVVVYSSYMYVINAIKTLLSKFSSSLYSLVGIKMLGDSEKENYKVFLELNSLMSFVSIVICASLIFAINPFIDIFYEGEVVTSKLLAFCFILMLFLSINSSTLYVYTNSTGLFKETKICTIVEAISNLVLSAIGMILFGIPGIVLATSISYIIADYIIKPRVLYKNVFKKESKKDFYKNFIIVSITFILFCFLNNLFKITISNIFIWFIICLVLFIANAILIYLVFKILKMNDWVYRIKKMLRRRMKNEN